MKRRTLIHFLEVVTLVAATGCQVDQSKEVSLYRKQLDATSPQAPSYDGDVALNLIDALALANRGNEQLGLSGEDYVQAIIAKHRAVAAFLPTLSFRPSFTLQQTPHNTTSVPNSLLSSGYRRINGNMSYQTQAPVVGQMNLFNGGGDLATLRSAEATIEQRRQALLNTQMLIMRDVAETYYAVLRAERSVAVLTDTLHVQQARLKDVQQQFANGLATNLAVSQTRAQLDSTRASLVVADGDVKNSRSMLAFLIGVPHVRGKLTDGFASPATVGDIDAFEQQAVHGRNDLLAAAADITAARERVTAAISQYYPSVSLNVQGFLYREYYTDASKWAAILQVNLPIFSAGLIEADVRTAWSQLRQAALNESYVRRQALNDVQQAYQNLITSDARVSALRDEVSAAEDAYRQSRDAFNANLAINLDVLTSQNQLLESQLELAGAEYDRSVYYLDLMRATGELTVNHVIALIASPVVTTSPTTAPTTQP
ncbi:MAG: TolC family protein [Tepidisphaeraceae bacterium]